MKTGSIVNDKQPKYDGSAVVLNITGDSARSVNIPSADKTVAEANPEYDPESKVAEVCFINSLNGKIPTWWLMDEEQFLSEVERANVNKYYYPVPRLEHVGKGLIDGVIVRVAGVADPFDYSKGAYAFEVSKLNSDISYTESSIVNEYDKVTKTISTLIGIKESLKWVEKRGRNEGVQIIIDDKEVMQKIEREYELRDSTTRKLVSSIEEASDTIPKVQYREAPKGRNKNLKEKAVQEYKESEQAENPKFEVDRVVDEEYIVDGIFSVNLDQNKCTCDDDEPCDHIRAVEKKVLN